MFSHSFDLKVKSASQMISRLKETELEIGNNCYIPAKKQKNSKELILVPRTEISLKKNSFVPEIHLAVDGNADNKIKVTLRLLKGVRWFIVFYFILCAVFQTALVILGFTDGGFSPPFFIPSFIILFAVVMTTLSCAIWWRVVKNHILEHPDLM